MENLTYETYLANPALREQLEREARRARAEAMREYIAVALMKMFRRMVRRLPAKPVPSLKRGASVKLEEGGATEVRVITGNVWLTQYKDTSDYVMRAGDRVMLNGKGTTLIYALADSSLRFAA